LAVEHAAAPARSLRRAPEHRRDDVRVDAEHPPAGLQPREEVGEARGVGEGLHLVGHAGHQGGKVVQRLPARAVEEPRVARLDPPDAVGRDAVVEQPDTGVHPGLAGADDDVPRRAGR
jgi:hypothetical protein